MVEQMVTEKKENKRIKKKHCNQKIHSSKNNVKNWLITTLNMAKETISDSEDYVSGNFQVWNTKGKNSRKIIQDHSRMYANFKMCIICAI